MAKGKRLTKRKNIKTWTQGTKNIKDINIMTYPRDQKKGIRFA